MAFRQKNLFQAKGGHEMKKLFVTSSFNGTTEANIGTVQAIGAKDDKKNS